MKILAQYNRSLEESEEEWVLVEMLGHEVFIQIESNGDEYDINTYTLETMSRNFPTTLERLREIQEASDWAEKLAREYEEQSQKIEKISLGEQPAYSLSEDEIERLYNGAKWEGMGT